MNIIPRNQDSSGVSLIELALVLPLIILLVTGLVDFGIKINAIKEISAVARHSARVAASHPRRVRLQTRAATLCSDPAAPIISGACPPLQGTGATILLNDPVTTAAYKTACNSLSAAHLDPSNWRVEAQVRETQEDNGLFQTIRVSIERINDECFICYDRLSDMFKATTESGFVLEENCAG